MSWTRQTVFRRARVTDIDAIMEIERMPGYERLVSRSGRARHLANLALPGTLTLVHDGADGSVEAFASLSGLGSAAGIVWLNQLAVRHPGRGTGPLLLDAVMAAVFEGSPARRLSLNVLSDNARAIALYRSRGFRDHSLLPNGARLPGGIVVDLRVMAIDWDDWEAMRDGDGPPDGS